MHYQIDSILSDFWNQYQKSDKILSITYADLQSLMKKVDGCESNSEKLSTTKISEHIRGYSMSPIGTFNNIENKYDVCRGEDCVEKFCGFLIKHAMK